MKKLHIRELEIMEVITFEGNTEYESVQIYSV